MDSYRVLGSSNPALTVDVLEPNCVVEAAST